MFKGTVFRNLTGHCLRELFLATQQGFVKGNWFWQWNGVVFKGTVFGNLTGYCLRDLFFGNLTGHCLRDLFLAT